MHWLGFFWLQMAEVQCQRLGAKRRLDYRDLGLFVSGTLRAETCQASGTMGAAGSGHPLPLLLFLPHSTWSLRPLLSVGYCRGLCPPGQDTWAHICSSWALGLIVSATRETDSLSSSSRITGEGEDCPSWGEMSTLDQSAVARSQPSAHNGSSVQVCVCVCV